MAAHVLLRTTPDMRPHSVVSLEEPELLAGGHTVKDLEIQWTSAEEHGYGHGVQFLHADHPYICIAFLQGYSWLRGGQAKILLLGACPASISLNQWPEVVQATRAAVVAFLSDKSRQDSQFQDGPIAVRFNA